MKILVLDTLIQTVDFDQPVRGGLVKSAILDVIALSQRHDVFYMYYGKPTYDYKFKSIILDDIGSKDWCLKNKKSPSLSHHKLKQDIPKMINMISDIKPDALIVHVCSKSEYLFQIAKIFSDTPKIFLFHDGVSNDDMFGTAGIIGTILRLRSYGSLITTNSSYTEYSINKVMRKREKSMRTDYKFMEEIPDVNTYKLFDKIYDYFVYYDPSVQLDIVENKDFSVNIGRFQKKKGVLNLLKLHDYNNTDYKVKIYGVKDPVFDPDLNDYKKIQDVVSLYNNYILCEAFSDEQLREDAKYGNNIVITCPVEGFGYTAFEMGIFGMPCIITKHGERHATEEYLQKIGAAYVIIPMKGNKDFKKHMYEAMITTKLSIEEKRINAQKFLDYFTIDNYINERELFIELAKQKIKTNIKQKNKLF